MFVGPVGPPIGAMLVTKVASACLEGQVSGWLDVGGGFYYAAGSTVPRTDWMWRLRRSSS